MARIEIKHKCVMTARNAARRDSMARITGRSVFIKRCPNGYRLIGVNVSKSQRKCRDIFADAQKLASYELRQWNKRRHWDRIAKARKVKGAHRMAVSHFYRLLKDNGLALDEALRMYSERRRTDTQRGFAILNRLYVKKKREEMKSPFFYKKFGNLEEYYESVTRLAS